MKNLKSFDEHERFAEKLRDGGAKVITYAMSDTSYTAFGASFLDGNNVAANFDSDEGKWGNTLECGVKTIPLDELRAYYEQSDGLVIMATGYFMDIAEYLDSLGLDYYHRDFMLGGLQELIADISRNDAEIIAANRDKIGQVRELLADERSRHIYDLLLAVRSSSDAWERFRLLCGVTTADQYFLSPPPPCAGLAVAEDEIFVDGGAYTGDTAMKFIKHTGGKYAHIYAFEPDPLNFEKLSEIAARYDNFTCYNKGLYSSERVLKFTCEGADGRIEGKGRNNAIEHKNHDTVEVAVCSIDETIGTPVTFIKMDIEGSELEALKGAERTIRRYKPKLTVCIYHKVEDFWEIPLYIHELVPEYKFYVRHHSIYPFCVETVLYAVL